MHLTGAIFSLATLATHAYAHGLVTAPAARSPGEATAAVCSQEMVDFYVADNTSYPEHFMREGGPGEGYDPELCDLWLCKGYQFEDNTENVMALAPGDEVDMEVFIRIPHLGSANVSVVDIASNSVVGEPLIEWAEGYADPEQYPDLPADQTAFSVTVPELGGQCTVAGECAMQWYWYSEGQTYQSCIDFVVPVVEPPIESRS